MSDSLKQIVKLASMLVKAQAKTAELEKKLAEAKAFQSQLEMEELPELMLELGMTSVMLDTGQTVAINDGLSCGITQEKSAAALAWLDKNNFGGLVKTLFTAELPREDRDKADYLIKHFKATAQETGVDPVCDLRETVHASTLKAFIKEELAKGTPIPLDLFSVHQYKKAVVIPAKKKK